ncbi:hypothetical protein J5N97_021609 [Dioscorea zingiberensis]|uniref:Pentatricopeptide repeat-containing protein n=1 Tax=Dioscorea zingiberensis TaxID=325984 RepID=A0A9D5HA13_9LILI|nr:hypothetical protein J5N97_021609 [Dioscorea zingiberensis]
MNASFATLYVNGNGTLTRTEAYLSLPRLIKACAKSSALSPGSQLHAISVKLELCSDVFVQTALLSFYSSFGYLDVALQLFDRMPQRNLVAWTAAIDACLRSDEPHAALSLFVEMRESSVVPDTFSLVSFLSACSSLCALDLGRGAHAHLSKTGTELTPFLGTALVDMYCKCGSVDDAVKMAEVVLDRIVAQEQPEGGTSHYLIMSNMYKDAGFRKKTAELRTRVGRKPKGRSWIEIAGKMHQFGVGFDVFSHPMWKEIKTILDEIARKEGNQTSEQLDNIEPVS